VPELLVPLLVFLAEFCVRLAFIARVLLHGQRSSSARLAWILVLVTLPVLGIATYLLVGEVRLGRARTRRHKEIVDRFQRQAAPHWEGAVAPDLLPEYRTAALLAEAAGGVPPRDHHEVELLADSAAVIDGLVADLDAAERHCHVLTYIYLDDQAGHRVGEALSRAARRGVACRLLVDSTGSRGFLRSPLAGRMREAGVRVVAALPASLLRAAFARVDVRNHRKLAVIDGEIAWTGSQNIAGADFALKPRFAPWVDAMLRIRGPAVRDLQQVFLADWFLDSDEALDALLAHEPAHAPGGIPVQIVPNGPDIDPVPFEQLVHAAFHLARSEIILTTPYFLPPDSHLASICGAARRGVETHVVVPARNDSMLVAAASRSLYEPMLRAGVHVHEYGPGLLHAKTMTVDRHLAFVGSANFDRRSFELNFEVNVLVFDSDFASRLRFLQRGYMSESTAVDPDRWRTRSVGRRVVENVAGLFSPLL